MMFGYCKIKINLIQQKRKKKHFVITCMPSGAAGSCMKVPMVLITDKLVLSIWKSNIKIIPIEAAEYRYISNVIYSNICSWQSTTILQLPRSMVVTFFFQPSQFQVFLEKHSGHLKSFWKRHNHQKFLSARFSSISHVLFMLI